MARQRRSTQPLVTVRGTLTDYAEIDPLLVDGEMKGRAWSFEQSRSCPRLSTPTDDDVKALHRAMFGGFLPWAGQYRRVEVGPGGVVNVPWFEVPLRMRGLADDLAAWVAALPADPSVSEVAGIVADAHHMFQWIHPFEDTNGRTGRVLDLYLVWVTFGLAKTNLEMCPMIDPFPTDGEEDEYYLGLHEADGYVGDRLRAYYTQRIMAAVSVLSPADDTA